MLARAWGKSTNGHSHNHFYPCLKGSKLLKKRCSIILPRKRYFPNNLEAHIQVKILRLLRVPYQRWRHGESQSQVEPYSSQPCSVAYFQGLLHHACWHPSLLAKLYPYTCKENTPSPYTFTVGLGKWIPMAQSRANPGERLCRFRKQSWDHLCKEFWGSSTQNTI